jgi:TolA-binding protein
MNNPFKRHYQFTIFLLALAIFLLPLCTQASEGQAVHLAKQFAFAEALFTEGDYYRAITEYKRFIFYFPRNTLIEKSSFRIGECYLKAKRWHEVIDTFALFTIQYPQSSMSMEALYLKGIAEKQLKQFSNSLSTFQEIIGSKSNDFTDKAIYQSALIMMEKEEWQEARKTFLLVPKNSPLSESANIMYSSLGYIDDIPQKSPAVAGTLAAILPGAGHLYTERPRDALVAFLLNVAFIVSAVELFHHENYVAGGIVTFFEIGWYTGNIFSAVSSAHKYNKRNKEDFIRHLQETSSISIRHDHATSSSHLMVNYRF